MENIAFTPQHPEPHFTEQDELLVTMMANVIATVIYNTQIGESQLEEFGNELELLSQALAGGREMRDLLGRVVETIMEVLGAEASALFLVDEATNKVVVQAAAGYHKRLMDIPASYSLGEGITGWIAREGRCCTDRQCRGAPIASGPQGQVPSRPRSKFFPWAAARVHDRSTNRDKIIGVLKVENVSRSVNHPEAYFTDQDQLLVTMMANVIATVIYSVRQGEGRIGDVLKRMGILSHPVDAARDLLGEFARSDDSAS